MRNSYDEKELQLMSYPLHKSLFKINSTKNQKKKLGIWKIRTILDLSWN
jgi:hypothetical protein